VLELIVTIELLSAVLMLVMLVDGIVKMFANQPPSDD